MGVSRSTWGCQPSREQDRRAQLGISGVLGKKWAQANRWHGKNGQGEKLIRLSLVLNASCPDPKFFMRGRAGCRPQARQLFAGDIRSVLPCQKGKHRRGSEELRDSAPEVYVPHHAVPHGIGTEEEEDEEGAAGGPLDTGEAAARRAVPHGQPDVLLEEASLQLCYEDPGEAPQLRLT